MIATLRLLLLVGVWILIGAGVPLLPALAQPAGSAPATAGKLRVGTFPDNKPWEFHDQAGTLVGFEVDMIKAAADRMGRSVEFVPMAFRDLFPALEDGQIDVAMCSISLTPEREKRFDTTQTYYDTSQGMVVLTSSHIRTLADLIGRTVSAEAGSTNEKWLVTHSARYGFSQIVPARGLDQAVQWLHEGKIDAYFGDMPALMYRLLDAPELAVVQRQSTYERYTLTLPRGSPLTEPLDAALSQIKQDGTLSAIHKRWFGAMPAPGSAVNTVRERAGRGN
ncbi:substrate-binding periplasmic protein [Ancylobacter pratisalsi]|uniref:Amino acid ABC transporter substrate-binding protein n=1 Tax=Ancylobacter pratisalsi TaxID=1745854 RepID=A0A6P1YJ79_9HYPH|nr:ABC transporter substrate-binding protein [Ancylobacter pratisalsi]QIB33437.1 amino acid ABC transporter substrate-binding protein [Ancylobacter pratisalsi]